MSDFYKNRGLLKRILYRFVRIARLTQSGGLWFVIGVDMI